MLSVTGLVPAEDVELFAALEDRADLETVRKARRDIAAHGTIPLARLITELGL
ncbi:MAG: hypothetical protein ACRESO_09025 [Gammaproteobacteria bacterium]